jgi:hypothetical protein
MTDSTQYDRLATASNRALTEIFRRSPPAAFDDIVGWQWRGWNTDPNLRYLGLSKFIKGFFRGENGDEGSNVRVRQSGLHDPWQPILRDGRIQPWAFYLVRPQQPATRITLNPRALLLDYGATPRNPWFHIERRIRDYLVQPSADEPDLLLGRAWLGFGSWRFPSSFFVLERWKPFDPADTSPPLVRRRRAPRPSS